ncbi:23S rRNA (pseudouridine(1915)-N(3))-methyltransferase RlmH [Fluviispira multicolorata]|uniref:Ribosomal RNA large subunit methyltransferase H n=1 Tax=Fluviispira multicolorata TaxID=2654512 RepID=A0A833JAA3_9BACT|nr:23S rRNA (pseudouridine(1915)-N(3))-methyltransferase RlmH [Fluviispira multicolorata]KAB8027759.1 hypothetical protein GCL57_14225 [Fluviispira multicolorata]
MRYIFITPWKLPKNSLLYDFIQEFLGRISKFTPVQHISPPATIHSNELSAFYAKEIKKISVEKPLCFALDENGDSVNSSELSKSLEQCELKGEKYILFCLGGAYGLPEELKALVRVELISLSKMTFPHEMAFAVLVEQVYRARCILSNHPYHHGDKSPLAMSIKSQFKK